MWIESREASVKYRGQKMPLVLAGAGVMFRAASQEVPVFDSEEGSSRNKYAGSKREVSQSF